MTRHFNNAKSVQAQLDELRATKEKLDVLQAELKDFMDKHGIEKLNGLTTCYVKTFVPATTIFDSTKFRNENPSLYEEYKIKEKSEYYKYEEKAIK